MIQYRNNYLEQKYIKRVRNNLTYEERKAIAELKSTKKQLQEYRIKDLDLCNLHTEIWKGEG